jgi:predicted RNA-binding Zn ribbon-like protein
VIPYLLLPVTGKVNPETTKLLGGRLCLDFANTIDWADGEPMPEYEALHESADLMRWGRRLGVLAATGDVAELAAAAERPSGRAARGDAAELAAGAERRPGRAARGDAAELAAAKALRAALYATFAALSDGARPPAAALARIARDHAEAAAAARLRGREGAWRMDWPADDPRRVRFAVAADAVALLADAERLARVHRCPGRNCGWLFLDTSGRRRWCSMQTCGSRAKMRRLYERRRDAPAQT